MSYPGTLKLYDFNKRHLKPGPKQRNIQPFPQKFGSRCNRYNLYGNGTDIASCVLLKTDNLTLLNSSRMFY